jgi:hypothetical protein
MKSTHKLKATSGLQTKWLNKKIDYDGTQLRSLFAYLDHGVLGHSLVAFHGACSISFAHMVDGEDLRDQSPICGDDMLHFIAEIFHEDLFAGVLFQRLLASLACDLINEKTKKKSVFREGDDLYSSDGRKLSISIAAKSVQSVMVHFAVNITNKGTPVKTLSLKDLNIKPDHFAKSLLLRGADEFDSVRAATMKVKPLS